MKRDIFFLESILDEIKILKDMLNGKDIEDNLDD
mgnify:FL=1